MVFAAAAIVPLPPAQARLIGITPDAEYLIFVVDTSPSMRRYEWDRVMMVMQDLLALYPAVRGIQVLNDNGDHLLENFRYQWIPDTPDNRRWIFEEIENWADLSDSNPRRGLVSAIDRYYDPEKTIALFVLGDDFSAGAEAIDAVVAEVEARNIGPANGTPRVRIHTVAFPVFYSQQSYAMFMNSTGADLATLMSQLSQGNDGSFLALSSRRGVTAGAAAAAAAGAAQSFPVADPERVLIVVDDSGNMREPYWRQAVDAVDWLLAEYGDEFQVMTLAGAARSVDAGTEGRWLSDADGSLRERLVADLIARAPAGTADLAQVPAIVRGLDPAPDAVYLLTASDSSLDPRNTPSVRIANPGGAPVDILLFGAENNPRSAPYYWALALDGGGSLLAPAEDWP
jgi:hypothetical protein